MARILVKSIENDEETLAKGIIQRGSYTGKDSHSLKTVDTALFFCCSRGLLELVKLLLDKGVSLTSTGKNLATPLHAAVDNGHLNVVRLLIERGANVNVQNYRGDTPLHLAAYRGYGQIIQCLMENGADSRFVNSNSFTAEHEAFIHGHSDLGCYLRLESSVRYSSQPETCRPFDSMIPLDSPSVDVNIGSHSQQQNNEKQELEKIVRNPPNQKYKIGLLTNFEPTGPPECSVFDSTLYSLKSLKYGPTLPPVNQSSSNNNDLILSDKMKGDSNFDNFDKIELTSINHSLPDNYSCVSPSRMFNLRPDCETYNPANVISSNFQIKDTDNGFFPSFNGMSSNDLSSLTESPPISMTRVNIPLN